MMPLTTFTFFTVMVQSSNSVRQSMEGWTEAVWGSSPTYIPTQTPDDNGDVCYNMVWTLALCIHDTLDTSANMAKV